LLAPKLYEDTKGYLRKKMTCMIYDSLYARRSPLQSANTNYYRSR